MEILRKLFLVIFVLIILIYAVLSVFMLKNGKSIIEERLSLALHQEVHVGKARLMFPMGLRFDDIKVEGKLTAKAFLVRFGIPLFLDGRLNMTKVKLSEPVFFVMRSSEGGPFSLGWAKAPADIMGGNKTPEEAKTSEQTRSSKGILINYLEIKNGKIVLWLNQHPKPVEIGQLNVKAMDIPLPPRELKTKFDLKAVILSEFAPFAGQKVEAHGMVNTSRKDMDANVKITDPMGNSSFSGHFKSVNNDMTVKGKINVGKFVSGMRTKDSKESGFEGFLANALESSGVDIGVNFTCQTKMDNFNCDKIGLSGNVVQTPKNP